jgi:hypothetical protein
VLLLIVASKLSKTNSFIRRYGVEPLNMEDYNQGKGDQRRLTTFQSYSKEVTIKEIVEKIGKVFNKLLRRWKLIFISALIGGCLGIGYAILKKPSYKAVSTFVLEDNQQGGSLGQYSAIASMVGVDLGGAAGNSLFQGDNLIELYKSRNMIQKTLLSKVLYNGSRVLLINRYIDINSLRAKWKDKPELSNLNFEDVKVDSLSRLQDSVLNIAVNAINKSYLTVDKLDKKLSIIKVEVNSPDERFSKDFNDQIVMNVNDFYIQTKTKKALQNLAILQHQTDSVRSVLNGAIYTSFAVNDATPNLNPTRQVLRASGQKSQFNAEANKAILTQLVQNLELAKITLRKETPLIQLIDKPTYPLEKKKTSKLLGFILGAFLMSFLCVTIILTKESYKYIMNS